MGHQAPVPHRAATISTNQYPPEQDYVFGTKIGPPMEPGT